MYIPYIYIYDVYVNVYTIFEGGKQSQETPLTLSYTSKTILFAPLEGNFCYRNCTVHRFFFFSFFVTGTVHRVCFFIFVTGTVLRVRHSLLARPSRDHAPLFRGTASENSSTENRHGPTPPGKKKKYSLRYLYSVNILGH